MKIQLYRYTHPDGNSKDWGWCEDRNPHIGIRLWWGVTGKSLQTRFKATPTPDQEGQKRAREKERKGYCFMSEINVDERTGKVMATGFSPGPEPQPDVQHEEAALYWDLGGCFMGLSTERLETLATKSHLILRQDGEGSDFSLTNPAGAHGLTRLSFSKTQRMAGILMLPEMQDSPSLLLALLALGKESGVFLTLANEQGIAIEPVLSRVLKHFDLCLNTDQKTCALRLGLLPQPLGLGQQPSFYFGGQSGQLNG